MRALLDIATALSDAARLRVLAALRQQELCLCHLVRLLRLAPSTVSRHLTLLVRAGLVERRQSGRWAYFRLALRSREPAVRRILRWILAALEQDATILRDARRLASLRRRSLQQVATCYRD
jgi:ArsR family transcriptional regulator